MEGAKFNQTPAGYDTYVGDPSHALQHGGDEVYERKCELGVTWEGDQTGGRTSFGELLRAALAEFIGMILFLFNAITIVRFIGDRNDPGETSASILVIAFGFGLSILALVYLLADASGANLNPAVSLGLLVGKRITVERFIVYVVAQVAGATIGASIATIFLEGTGGGFNALAPGVSAKDALCGEIMCTFLLVIVVLAATDGELRRKTGHTAALLPLVIGLVILLDHLVLIPVDGCSINPARSFATAFTNSAWANHWVFWLGPLAGGVLAAIVWECVLRPEQPAAKGQFRPVTEA